MQEYRQPITRNWQLAGREIEKTAFYEIDLATSLPVVKVSTKKGVIELKNLDSVLPGSLLPSFANPLGFWIDNPELDLTTANRDNVYAQITSYYKPAADDSFIPHIVVSGFLSPNGLGLSIYNANPATAGADQCEGAFYIYYEVYDIRSV